MVVAVAGGEPQGPARLSLKPKEQVDGFLSHGTCESPLFPSCGPTRPSVCRSGDPCQGVCQRRPREERFGRSEPGSSFLAGSVTGRLACHASPDAGPDSSFLTLSRPELFPVPVLRATPSAEPQEGDAVTLSCQTKLPLQRSAVRLLFSFHKDGQTVRSWGPTPELQIPAASEAHAGSYWCEATTEDNRVWKQSPRLEVSVQGESACVEGGPPSWGSV